MLKRALWKTPTNLADIKEDSPMNTANEAEQLAPQSAAAEGIRRRRRRYARVDKMKAVCVVLACGGDVSKASRKLKMPRKTVAGFYGEALQRVIQHKDQVLTHSLAYWREQLGVSLEAVARALLEGVPKNRVEKVAAEYRKRLASEEMPVPGRLQPDPVPAPAQVPEPAPAPVAAPKPVPPPVKVKPKVWFTLPVS